MQPNKLVKRMFPMNSVHFSLKDNPQFKKFYKEKNIPIDQMAFKTLYEAAKMACDICVKQQHSQSIDSNSTQNDVYYSKDFYSKVQQLSDDVLNKLGEPILRYSQLTKRIINYEERIQQASFRIDETVNEFKKEYKVFSEEELIGQLSAQEIQDIVNEANGACARLIDDGILEIKYTFEPQEDSIKLQKQDSNGNTISTENIEVTEVASRLKEVVEQIKEKIQDISSSIDQRRQLFIKIIKQANINDINKFVTMMKQIQEEARDIPIEQLNQDIKIPEEEKNNVNALTKRVNDYFRTITGLQKQVEQYETNINEMKKREYNVKVREKDQEALIQELTYTKKKLKEEKENHDNEINGILTEFGNTKAGLEEIIQKQDNFITTSQTAQKAGMATSAFGAIGVTTVLAGNKFFPEKFTPVVNLIILSVVIILTLATIYALSQTVKKTKPINNEQPVVSKEKEKETLTK